MRGIYTALITPFKADGRIDEESLDRLLEQQKRSKVDGVVVCGTTAESPTLEREEKLWLMKKIYKDLAGSGIEVIAGTGSNDTEETIQLTLEAEKIGINKFLLVTPYYNKPTQQGLLEHFTKIANHIQGEIVLYNVPSRTSIGIHPETVGELAMNPKIVAIKEASGDVSLTSEIRSVLARRGIKDFSILSGDDATFFPLLCMGAMGVISVTSHVIAGPMKKIQNFVESGRVQEACALHDHYYPIFRDTFVETNPAPIKWLLSQLGICENRLRLPLVPVSVDAEKKLQTLMTHYRTAHGVME
jgi:4-hydroxy-tetrahydrodipicolinate synthase